MIHRKYIYLSAASAFEQYKENDLPRNISDNVAYGLCGYMEVKHGTNIITTRDRLPELDLFWDFDRNEFDGHLAACTKAGADIRATILCFCYELIKKPI